MSRKLIHSAEGKISYLQIIGFIVIFFGLIYLFVEQVSGKLDDKSGGGIIAMDFFTIMLGIAFAFPDLLSGVNGLSTMRIVVFMIVNVICILLLKIGWGKADLGAIKLDQYWMGVIAFVFGAKATQTYFESKLAVPPPPPPNLQPPADELDGCGIKQTQLTADADLPASKGGVV